MFIIFRIINIFSLFLSPIALILLILGLLRLIRAKNDEGLKKNSKRFILIAITIALLYILSLFLMQVSAPPIEELIKIKK